MVDSDKNGFNLGHQNIPESYDFSDIRQMAADALNDETTAGFLMVPYQDTEEGERIPVIMACDEELINNPRAAYELYTKLAGTIPIELAQSLDGMTLQGMLEGIEYESRTMSGETPADVRHEIGWQVETPTVYRYLEQEYIDKFFQEGVLQLSSFSEFRQHEDEMRNDSEEGVNIITIEGEEYNMSVVSATGMDAYVFCGSTIVSDTLRKEFEVDGYFKINDTRGFGKEIAKSLEQSNDINRVEQGIEGFCKYTDGNLIRKEAKIKIPEGWKDEDYEAYHYEKSEGELSEPLKGRRDETKAEEELPGNWKDVTCDDDISIEDLEAQINQNVGYDPLFTKHERFQKQSEYRLLWLVDGDLSNTIQIECPEALEYCEKVT